MSNLILKNKVFKVALSVLGVMLGILVILPILSILIEIIYKSGFIFGSFIRSFYI